MAKQGVDAAAGDYGVGMVFLLKTLPATSVQKERNRGSVLKARFFLMADVLVNRHADVADRQGEGAGDPPGLHRPRPDVFVTDALERKAYVIRRRAANAIQALQRSNPRVLRTQHVSARTINSRGLRLADQVGSVPTDLQDAICFRALPLPACR